MPVFTKDGVAVLYVHVPKAGGTSVEQLFRRAGWSMTYRDGNNKEQSPNWYRRCSPQHMHAALLAETFRLERFDAVFMTVREPLARFRSEYAMREAVQAERRGRAFRLDADAVERWGTNVLDRYLDDPYILDNHIRPQTEFRLPGSIVYRLEDGLDAAVADLNARFDLGLPTEVPRALHRQEASGVASGSVEISPRLERHLRVFYAQDLGHAAAGPAQLATVPAH